MSTATAAAHPNLAFVKYWGRRDAALNIPENGSISVNLSGATTATMVIFDGALGQDAVTLNDAVSNAPTLARVTAHLDRVRALAGITTRARVVSHNDFPADVGFASSSSAFAALSLAATRAAGLDLDPHDLSVLARKGSGSACRSIPDGFVEWLPGWDDASSYARSIAPCDHWDLRVVTVTLPGRPKLISSLAGHQGAPASPFYRARLKEVPHTLDVVRRALLARDFASFGLAVEREALSLHAVAMTSHCETTPWLSGVFYMEPETVRLIRAVQMWRRDGLPVAFTLDAGPTVHLLCEGSSLGAVLAAVTSVMDGATPQVIVSRSGRGVWLVNESDGASAPSDSSYTT
ncbi:MAG: diphosphomevalonate decarboxylase [Anaerolineae bacterium]|nr:diphosphomevalonate decarboxylase [Anaerolineae bacterium]